MSITRAADFIYALRIVKLLVTPWEKQAAYKYGIIDKDGNLLRKFDTLNTGEEKDSFTYLHRIVFNIKRMLSKIPGGKSTIGAAAASYLLLRESFKDLEISEADWNQVQVELTKMVEETPTNVTGTAASTDTPKPLAVVRRIELKPPKKKELTVKE